MSQHAKAGTTWVARHIEEVVPVRSLCGSSTRVLTAQDNPTASIHITHIRDSEKHFHRQVSEFYYVLEGSGFLELDEENIQLRPGLAVYIPPGVRHRGKGDFTAAIFCVPPFREEDSHPA